jgi:hypothetical protein
LGVRSQIIRNLVGVKFREPLPTTPVNVIAGFNIAIQFNELQIDPQLATIWFFARAMAPRLFISKFCALCSGSIVHHFVKTATGAKYRPGFYDATCY